MRHCLRGLGFTRGVDLPAGDTLNAPAGAAVRQRGGGDEAKAVAVASGARAWLRSASCASLRDLN